MTPLIPPNILFSLNLFKNNMVNSNITDATNKIQFMWSTEDSRDTSDEPLLQILAVTGIKVFISQGSARHMVASMVLHPIELLNPMLHSPVWNKKVCLLCFLCKQIKCIFQIEKKKKMLTSSGFEEYSVYFDYASSCCHEYHAHYWIGDTYCFACLKKILLMLNSICVHSKM